MVRMLVNMGVGVKHNFSLRELLEQVGEKLLDVSDYLVYRKCVTLSEAVLFGQTIGRALWYLFFGVTGGIYLTIAPSRIWVAIFGGLAIVKILSFFLFDVRFRGLTCIASALLWPSLTILAVMSGTTDPAVPTFAVFALLSLI